jgi:hypothetical protein
MSAEGWWTAGGAEDEGEISVVRAQVMVSVECKMVHRVVVYLAACCGIHLAACCVRAWMHTCTHM